MTDVLDKLRTFDPAADASGWSQTHEGCDVRGRVVPRRNKPGWVAALIAAAVVVLASVSMVVLLARGSDTSKVQSATVPAQAKAPLPYLLPSPGYDISLVQLPGSLVLPRQADTYVQVFTLDTGAALATIQIVNIDPKTAGFAWPSLADMGCKPDYTQAPNGPPNGQAITIGNHQACLDPLTAGQVSVRWPEADGTAIFVLGHNATAEQIEAIASDIRRRDDQLGVVVDSPSNTRLTPVAEGFQVVREPRVVEFSKGNCHYTLGVEGFVMQPILGDPVTIAGHPGWVTERQVTWLPTQGTSARLYFDLPGDETTCDVVGTANQLETLTEAQWQERLAALGDLVHGGNATPSTSSTATATEPPTASVPVTTFPATAGAHITATVSRVQTGWQAQLHLEGGKPGETIRFTVTGPAGSKDLMIPHTASEKGTVDATYLSNDGDPLGTYVLEATGSSGTGASIVLHRTSSGLSYYYDGPCPSGQVPSPVGAPPDCVAAKTSN